MTSDKDEIAQLQAELDDALQLLRVVSYGNLAGQEIADYLNVSLEYVEKIVASGELVSAKTDDVRAYKRAMRAQQTAALDELCRQSEEMGLYQQ